VVVWGPCSVGSKLSVQWIATITREQIPTPMVNSVADSLAAPVVGLRHMLGAHTRELFAYEPSRIEALTGVRAIGARRMTRSMRRVSR
jgi:hypothetical protein